MTLGKQLRLRRIFANGRALIVNSGPLADDPLARVRALARAGVDALVLTPGVLDVVAEELGMLSVILRVDAGFSRTQQFLSVQAALEMGADAVLIGVAARQVPADSLERFGRVAEEARRLGMPVIAEISGQDWLDTARLAADYGADIIQSHLTSGSADDRHLVRTTGRQLVATLGDERIAPPALLDMIDGLMEGAVQGVVLEHPPLIEPPMIDAIHALLHQGVSAAEAAAMVRGFSRV